VVIFTKGEARAPRKFIGLSAIDFLTFGCGPWDHDHMAPSGPSDPQWHGSHPRFQALLEEYADAVEH
jgi:hypothetical protein